MRHLLAVSLLLLAGHGAVEARTPMGSSQRMPVSLPRAIYTDPAPDKAHPARMAVLHVPSGGVAINGVAYLAAGPGPHPTLVICHGLPGNEKNLDLAQAVRRAGWNAITFNYRGSWGSPGDFRFGQNPEDAAAVLAYLRDPAHAAELGVDPRRIAIVGHSMGGWVAALTGAADGALLGVGLVSAANLPRVAAQAPTRDALIAFMADNMESLHGTSAGAMADEVRANMERFDFTRQAPALAARPLLLLTSDDGLAPHADELAAAVRAAGGRRITAAHVPTDHGWSDRRIALEARILTWLATLAR